PPSNHTALLSGLSESLSYSEDDVKIWTLFDVTHQSRDRGVTGASPDVSLAIPLSAERTHSQEPG
ncbi:Mediator of DNA damage checkpoint protein 1, partial [Dissostichus eleginoides]